MVTVLSITLVVTVDMVTGPWK